MVCGKHHTLALTEDGKVWSWGFGGQTGNWFTDIFAGKMGALGSGKRLNRYAPGQVESISEKVKSLTSGDDFVTVVTESGKVLNWGAGAKGVFADGLNRDLVEPKENQNFNIMAQKAGLKIQKVISAGRKSVALFSDGNLYAWGENSLGALGIRDNLTHRVDDVALIPTPIANSFFQGEKIRDFDLGQDTLLVLTENNKVYFSGLDLTFKPQPFDVPTDKKIVGLNASADSMAVLTEEGKIFSLANYANHLKNKHSYQEIDTSIFEGKVTQIGGRYDIRYALVQ